MTAVGPLVGIRVVEVAELLPGPFFTHSLAEMGAEVVKVERPGAGDPMRTLRPASYDYINRNKTVVQHDVRTNEGVDAILGLLQEADIFVEGSRPGVMGRRGLGWERVAAQNARIVYVSLSGFGQQGPLAQVPGHDLNYQAYSGLLSLGGRSDQGPELGNALPMSDYAGASYALSATLAALLHRVSTGRGQYLDISIADAIGHWTVPLAAHLDALGSREMDEVRSSLIARPGYSTFRCADGQWIGIGALEPRFLARLLLALEFDDSLLAESAESVNERIAERIAILDLDAALSLLLAHDVPATAVNTPVQYSERRAGVERIASPRDLPGFPVNFAHF